MNVDKLENTKMNHDHHWVNFSIIVITYELQFSLTFT